MTGRKLPGGQTEQLAYNAGGQLLGKTDFAGKVTTYAYDQRGRLVAKTPDASLGENAISFSYPNELTKISTRGSIQNIYRYDAQRGWLDSVQTPNGTLEYNYDAAGNRTQLKVTGRDGGTRIANFTYDALNRVSQITRPGVGTLATYSYNAVGNRTQTQRANGITSTYGYDDLHRLTGIEHKKGTEVLSQFAYDLNDDGKRGTLTEYVKYPEGQTVASINRTVHYGYDNAGRLIGEQRLSHQTLAAGGSVDKTAHTVWTYDKANNRTTQNLSNYDGLGTDAPSVLTSTHATQYNYNNNDWLQNQTSEHTTSTTSNTYTTNYEYNGNGSQSAVTTNVGTPDQKRTPYFYDFEEKLIGIGNPADTTKHAYAYDADGNRVTETNYANGTPTTKHYLIDSNVSHAQVVEEFDSANQLIAHHDWDDAELLRSAVADSEGNTHITHPLADGHNSTRQLMDATGSIGGVLGYDAWGNTQESIGISSAYRYNGQRLDASGLYHLRARQYAPWTGRFLSHDPILGDANNPVTQHRYLYAGNDAVNLIDPSGESFIGNVMIGVTWAVQMSVNSVFTLQFLEMDSSSSTPQIPSDIYDPTMEFNHQYIDVAGNADKMNRVFDYLTEFKEFGPAPTTQSKVRSLGDTALWHWNDFLALGDRDFYVRSNQFIPEKYFFSVETMQGHPLRGHRFWEVSQLGPNTLRIETGAVEKPNTWLDAVKLSGGGRWFMAEGWNRMLRAIAREASLKIINDHTDVGEVSVPAPRAMAKKMVDYS